MISPGLTQDQYYQQFTHNVKMWVYSYYEDFVPLSWLNRQGFRIYLTGPDLFAVGMGLLEDKPSITVVVDRLSEGSGSRQDLLNHFQHVNKLPYGQFRYSTDNLSVHAKTLGGAFAVMKDWGTRERDFKHLSDLAMLNVHAASMDLMPFDYIPFILEEKGKETAALEPRHRFVACPEFYNAYTNQRIDLHGDRNGFTTNQIRFIHEMTDRLAAATGWKVAKSLTKLVAQDVPTKSDAKATKTKPVNEKWDTY